MWLSFRPCAQVRCIARVYSTRRILLAMQGLKLIKLRGTVKLPISVCLRLGLSTARRIAHAAQCTARAALTKRARGSLSPPSRPGKAVARARRAFMQRAAYRLLSTAVRRQITYIIGRVRGETLESVSLCTRFSGFSTISSFSFNCLS